MGSQVFTRCCICYGYSYGYLKLLSLGKLFDAKASLADIDSVIMSDYGV